MSGRKTAVRKTVPGRAESVTRPSPPPAADPPEDKEVALPEPVPESQEPIAGDTSVPGLSEGQLSEEDLLHCQRAKKMKAKTHPHLTDEQEEDMVQWLKAYQVFYNNKLQNYRTQRRSSCDRSRPMKLG